MRLEQMARRLTADRWTVLNDLARQLVGERRGIADLQGEDEYGSWRPIFDQSIFSDGMEVLINESGKTRRLNKPFRTPDGPKKFSVYVKGPKGTIVKVSFGDPNMKIKRGDPGRRKNFRARHNCEDPGPKWKARYWACRTWEKDKTVDEVVNAFCPTGEGGGHDNSCSSRKGGGERKEYTQDLNGEFWLDGSSSLFADGDIGDMNHEAYALQAAMGDVADAFGVEYDGNRDDWDSLREKIVEDNPEMLWIFDEDDMDGLRKELKDRDLSEDTWYIAIQGATKGLEPRFWAAKEKGWVRMAGNSLQMVGISGSKMVDTANAIADAFPDESIDLDGQSFDLEVIASDSVGAGRSIYSRMYYGVPYEVLSSGEMSRLKEYGGMVGNQDPSPSVADLLSRLTGNAGYFGECERDEKGRCKAGGGSAKPAPKGRGTKGSKPPEATAERPTSTRGASKGRSKARGTGRETAKGTADCAKCDRAKKAHVMVGKDDQARARKNEAQIAKILGGASFEDSEPADVIVPDKSGVVKHGLEVKSILKGKNDKITMDKYAQVRKIDWEKRNGTTFHTVIVDDRDPKARKLYYKRGVAGSARLSSLHPVKNAAELKLLVNSSDDGLPEKARRTDQAIRVGKWKPIKGERAFKNNKTGQIARAKK